MSIDILFIIPPSPRPTSWALFQNVGSRPMLGIGYMMAFLEEHQFTTELMNCYLGINCIRKFTKRIRTCNPKMVGITSSTDTFKNAILIANIIKKVNSKIVVVIGGPHVTFMDEETLHNDCIDIVVRNEGEYTILELAKFVIHGQGALHKIKGVSYHLDHAFHRNPPRELIKDLDSLPLPKRIAMDGTVLYKDYIGISSSRGCPYKCIFCAAGAMSGGLYRMRSACSVFDEIHHFYKKDIRIFKFYDDTITADIHRLHEICHQLNQIQIQWSAESRVDVIDKDPDIFKLMSKVGCQSLQFGIESGSQEMLDKIHKGTTLSQIERAVSLASKENIRIFGSMMIGHPDDTIETVKESIQFALYLQSKYEAGIIFGITTPFPGTYLMKNAGQLGIKIITDDYNNFTFINPVISGRYLTARDRRNLLYEASYLITREMPTSWQRIWKATI